MRKRSEICPRCHNKMALKADEKQSLHRNWNYFSCQDCNLKYRENLDGKYCIDLYIGNAQVQWHNSPGEEVCWVMSYGKWISFGYSLPYNINSEKLNLILNFS